MSLHLAVDTSTDACSVALAIDGAVQERFEPMQREHTQRLLPMIHGLLAESGRGLEALDGIACGIGPGSFAGLRIGVGVVKGLALARDLPVVGVSSLAMLAQRALAAGAPPVVAVIDARLNEVYVGAYRRGDDGRASAVMPDLVCAPDAAPPLPAGPWLGVGSGWRHYETALRRALQADVGALDPDALPHAADALALALPEFAVGRTISADALAPAYLRDSVALTLVEQAARRR